MIILGKCSERLVSPCLNLCLTMHTTIFCSLSHSDAYESFASGFL